MEIPDSDWPAKTSPRDHKPWEVLKSEYEWPDSLFMYQQVAREIADTQGWSDERLTALLERMVQAIQSNPERLKASQITRLPTRDRLLGTKRPDDMPDPFLGLVTPDDVNAWLRAEGLAEWMPPDAQAALEAAPVVEAPDPERRLAALRALAGTAQWKRGRDGVQQWRFTGIQGLVEKEKSEGRKRSDEQTIRGDLREAAQAESMEKRNGWNK